MHLLLLTQHDITAPRDSNALRVVALAAQFCSVGNDISVIRFRQESESPSTTNAPFTIHDIVLPRSAGTSAFAALNNMMDNHAEKIALDLNKSKHIDVVQSDVLWAATSGARIARKLRVPHVFIPHKCETLVARQFTEAVQARRGQISGTPLANLNMSMVQMAEKKAVESSSITLIPSNEQIKEMVAVGIPARKMEVLPAGTNIYPLTEEARIEMKAYLGLWRETPTAIFLGRPDSGPDLEAYDFICQEVAPRCPAVIFMVVGFNPPRTVSPPNVMVVGPADREDIYLGASDLEIVPLTSGASAGSRILDGWAAGLPVISTSIGADGLGYSDGVNILIENDMARFPSRIMGVLTQPQLAQKLAEGALEAAYPYRWEALGRRYTQTLEALVGVA